MEIGAKVNGQYHGVFFTGTIVSRRWLTVPTRDNTVEYFVSLDNPLSLYGTKRETVVAYTQFDGSPSHYNGYASKIVLLHEVRES